MKEPTPVQTQYRGFRIQCDGDTFTVFDKDGEVVGYNAPSMEGAKRFVDLWIDVWMWGGE